MMNHIYNTPKELQKTHCYLPKLCKSLRAEEILVHRTFAARPSMGLRQLTSATSILLKSLPNDP